MLVGWYLRRAIPWMVLLGCCAGACVLVLALDRWPSTALVMLPALLASCAAAAAFCFDEAALEVVAVTPRGSTWRRTARLGVAGLPLLVWSGAIVVRPGDLPLDRAAWWLVGFASIVLTAGIAALLSHRAVPAPGSTVATAAVLAAISPVVVAPFFGWGSLYPVGGFGAGVLSFWLAVAGTGALVCVAALRPNAGN